MLLGLSVLLLTAAALPATPSVCRQDNLWAEEVVLAELAPEAEALLTEDPDWGLLCPGGAAPQALKDGDAHGACAVAVPGPGPGMGRHRIKIHSGRCEVRSGGKARVFLRQRATGGGPRHLTLLVAAWRTGPPGQVLQRIQPIGEAGSTQPDQADDGALFLAGPPLLPRPEPAGLLQERSAPPIHPGFQRGIDRPPRFA